MKLAETSYDNSETGCCARLAWAKWADREVEWNGKPFLKDHIRALMHVPVNMASVLGRDQKAIENAAAYPEDPIWLSDEVSPWRSEVYIAVDHPVAGTETVELSGKFLTKAFQGPFRDAGKWIKAMNEYVATKGLETKKNFFFYATCPKCAKQFGENRVVLFAQVA